MSSALIIIDCYGAGGRHVLRERREVGETGSELIIGRAMDVDVSVEDAKLAPRQIQLSVTPNQPLSIKNLSPDANMRIDGKKVQDEAITLEGPVTLSAGGTKFEIRTSWDEAPKESQSDALAPRWLTPVTLSTLAAISLALAQLTYTTWLEAVSGFWDSWFQGILVFSAFIGIWSLVWASIGRLASGRWAFLIHLAIIAGMFGVSGVLSDLYTLAWFALGFSWNWYDLFSVTFDLFLLALALFISLYVATQLAPRTLAWIAVPALILAPIVVYWFGVHAQSKDVNLVRSAARIYPPGLSLSSKSSISEFVEAARTLKGASEHKRDQLPAVED